MTKGLLKSRETKKNLYMTTLTDRSLPALQRYKDYKNLYFKTLRAMKKLEANAKTQRKLVTLSMKCRERQKNQKGLVKSTSMVLWRLTL